MKLADDALDIDWSAFGAAEMLSDYFSQREDADIFHQIQRDLTELVREVISANPSSRDRLVHLGLTDYDIVRFYIANAVIHWAIKHGFEDSQGNEREEYLSRLFQDTIHDLQARRVLAARYISYLQTRFYEVVAARASVTDDPHEITDGSAAPEVSPSPAPPRLSDSA